ncbi:hypothetical protein KI688_005081 [Linnemannia hyalina]|uniref:Uncharacterized protein n=1 Tax=Linnemannia hyalina TaxID=64524 RepID=A0A9P7XJZ9_9FUNG|nr:hypothetical protein KI688_005081 [Linnemannia hyalina]
MAMIIVDTLAAATILASLAHASNTLSRASSSVDVVSQTRNSYRDFSDKSTYSNRATHLLPSMALATNFSDLKQGGRAPLAHVPINSNTSNIKYNAHSDDRYGNGTNVIQSNAYGRSINYRRSRRHYQL